MEVALAMKPIELALVVCESVIEEIGGEISRIVDEILIYKNSHLSKASYAVWVNGDSITFDGSHLVRVRLDDPNSLNQLVLALATHRNHDPHYER
jgi:hypothetical protein